MIKIDYLIERNEKNEIKKYIPDLIPTELPNVVCIQAKNSTGKSTLLNIIALAFFGQKLPKDELNQDLRNRLDILMDSNHQKLKFKIEVENEILGTKFVSQKEKFESPDIVLRKITAHSNSPITADSFRREYKLIYDIPDDPLERLPKLLNNLKETQKDVVSEIAKARNQILKIINEIKDSRDPELISKLKEKLKGDKSDYEEKFKNKKELENKYQKIRTYYFSRFLHHYVNEEASI